MGTEAEAGQISSLPGSWGSRVEAVGGDYSLTAEIGMRPPQGKLWNLSGPAKLKGPSNRTSPLQFLPQGGPTVPLHLTKHLLILDTQLYMLPPR